MFLVKRIFSYFCIFFISFNVYAEPEFEFKSSLLTLPTVRVDGVLFRNALIILGSDGVWSLQSIDAPQEKNNPICDIERTTARSDALEDITERHTPNFSTIEFLLNDDMEAYDEICQMEETPVLLEILNDVSERHYPNFSTILFLTKDDLESYANLQ